MFIIKSTKIQIKKSCLFLHRHANARHNKRVLSVSKTLDKTLAIAHGLFDNKLKLLWNHMLVQNSVNLPLPRSSHIFTAISNYHICKYAPKCATKLVFDFCTILRFAESAKINLAGAFDCAFETRLDYYFSFYVLWVT